MVIDPAEPPTLRPSEGARPDPEDWSPGAIIVASRSSMAIPVGPRAQARAPAGPQALKDLEASESVLALRSVSLSRPLDLASHRPGGHGGSRRRQHHPRPVRPPIVSLRAKDAASRRLRAGVALVLWLILAGMLQASVSDSWFDALDEADVLRPMSEAVEAAVGEVLSS